MLLAVKLAILELGISYTHRHNSVVTLELMSMRQDIISSISYSSYVVAARYITGIRDIGVKREQSSRRYKASPQKILLQAQAG